MSKFIQRKDTNIPDCELRLSQYIGSILSAGSCAAGEMAPIVEPYQITIEKIYSLEKYFFELSRDTFQSVS